MQLPGDAIWLPGAGELKFSEMHAARAVEEYDADLLLGQRKDTGEWCVFLPGNRASGGQPFPVLGLGFELPNPDKIKALLFKHDVRRNGQKMLDDLDRTYDREQAAIASKAAEGAERAAEAIASDMNRKGVSPFPTIYPGRAKYGGGRVRSTG